MDGTFPMAALLLLPAGGAAASLLLRSARQVLVWTCAWVAAYAAAVLWTAWAAAAGGPLEAASGWLFVDALSAFHLVLVAAVFAMATAYSFFYFGREAARGEFPDRIARRFGALWAAAIASMTIVLTSNNLGIMWVGVELTTLSTAFLIRLHVTPESLEATWKYLMVCSIGVALAFMGVVLFASSARGVLPASEDALMWRNLVAAADRLDPGLARAGFLFVLIGFGTKAGLAPMHTWLPDAHSQAPAPVSAVFSGTLLSAAFYCILRYLPIAEGATGHTGWAQGLLVLFGVASVLVAAAFMVFQSNTKRLLAYSSVEHLGIVALAAGLGPAGLFAALFHSFNHSVSKSAAFFAAGGMAQEAAGPQGPQAGAMGGPWRGVLAIALLSLVGAGPFAILASEALVVQAAASAGAWWALAFLVLGGAVAFVGVLRHAADLLGPHGEAESSAARRAPRAEVACVVLPLAFFIALALWMPPFFASALTSAAAAVAGGV